MPGLFSRKQAPAARDYRPEDTPATPAGLFFFLLKTHFGSLVKLNLLYFLFLLPTVVWLFIMIQMINGVLTRAHIVEETVILSDLIPYLNLFLMGCVVTLLPVGPAQCGLAYVLRYLSQDKHVFVREDFFDALKANWKQGLTMIFIDGLIMSLGFIAIITYSVYAAQNQFLLFFCYFILVVLAFFLMMNKTIFPMIVTYEMRLFAIIKTSMILTLARLPRSIIATLLSTAPLLLVIGFSLYGNMSIGLTVGLIYYILIGCSLSGLIDASYSNMTFKDLLITPEDSESRTNPEDQA